jgi:hypothetical protein
MITSLIRKLFRYGLLSSKNKFKIIALDPVLTGIKALSLNLLHPTRLGEPVQTYPALGLDYYLIITLIGRRVPLNLHSTPG